MLELIREAYEVIEREVDLDSESNAQEAFMLLGALSAEEVYELDEDSEVLVALQDNFEGDHIIWDYIRLYE